MLALYGFLKKKLVSERFSLQKPKKSKIMNLNGSSVPKMRISKNTASFDILIVREHYHSGFNVWIKNYVKITVQKWMVKCVHTMRCSTFIAMAGTNKPLAFMLCRQWREAAPDYKCW